MKRFRIESLVCFPWITLFGSLLLGEPLPAQVPSRTEIPFPDLDGLVTLRCDFHLHTVFSDGDIWPDARAKEAWQTGLDAIALTDHLEYLPHKKDLPAGFGRPYEIARATAEPLGVTAICGAEITRGEPPGHTVAIFLTNVAALNQEDYRVATRNAAEQGAFLFWAHPGWKQPKQQSVWYAERGEFLSNGWLHGIEIVNGNDYDPIAHQWCLDKKLTMLGDSDAHDPTGWDYSGTTGDMRPVTLVFARDRTAAAIREALFARRTAVFSGNRLIGEPQFLEPLFQRSIQIVNPEIRIRGKGRATVQIRNQSPLRLELRLESKLPELDVPDRIMLPPGRVSLLNVRCISDRVTGEQEVALPCKVLNLLVAPNRGLTTSLRLKVKYERAN